jgi:hypothetical protein
MKKRRRDFIGMFLFTFIPLTLLTAIVKWLVIEYNHMYSIYPIPWENELYKFLKFELFFVVLSTLISLIYVTRFNEYKKDQYGRERKRRKRH